MLLFAAAGAPTACLYALGMLLFCFVGTRGIKALGLREYLLPALIVLALTKLHLAAGAYFLPDVAGYVGSGFRFRSGLDGATTWMKGDYFSLFTDRLPVPGPNTISWGAFFALGSVALAAAMFWGPRGRSGLPFYRVILPSAMLGLLLSVVFVQALIIHPYIYDCYIAIPYVLCIYGFLAGFALRLAPEREHVVLFLIIMLSISLVMIDLRLVALDFPRPASNWGDAISSWKPS
jgi:hypothetical protein